MREARGKGVKNDDVIDENDPKFLEEKLKEYVDFIEKRLQPELQTAISNREEVENEIREYGELNETLVMLKEKQGEENPQSLESLVDLGGNLVHCRAVIPESEKIVVDVCMGIHVELTLDEGINYTNKKISHLEDRILPTRVEKAQRVAADLEGALHLLESVGNEMKSNDMG